jgi:hemoglobin
MNHAMVASAMPEVEDAVTPYDLLGGREATLALSEAFYDAMDAHEPELAKLHELDEHGKVSRGARDRFGLFLVGWLGGPQEYMAQHGHPRLRMRHAHLVVGADMRDAWLRAESRELGELLGGARPGWGRRS